MTILGAALGAVAGKVLGMRAAEEKRRLLIGALEGRVAELTAT